MPFATVICPICREETTFDPDNDTILCGECGAMLDIIEEGNGRYTAVKTW